MAKLMVLAVVVMLGATQARDLAPVNSAGDVCQTCLVGVRILEDFLCDPYATDFMVEFLEKRVCPIVGDSPKCYNIAEGLLPMVVQWFRATATPATLCSAAGVCGVSLQEDRRLNRPALRVHDNNECAMCQFVVTRVKTAVDDPVAIEHVKKKALEVCLSLPGQLAQGCTEFVNTYEPLIAQFLDSVDPEQLCELLGVCMEKLTKVQLPALPASLVRGLETVQTIQSAHSMMGVAPSNDPCDVCKMAVIEAHSLVSNPAVQQDIVNYTKALCESFPSFADACKIYVDEYAPLVFSLLNQYLVPDQLCMEIGVCPPPSLFKQVRSGSLLKNLGSVIDKHIGQALGRGQQVQAYN